MADPAKIITKWFGDIVIREIVDAVKEATDESTASILKDARENCPRDTGALADSGQVLPAKEGRKEIYGRVIFGGKKIQYALFPELRTKFLRRAMMANEVKSMTNFEGKLGVGKRRVKK